MERLAKTIKKYTLGETEEVPNPEEAIPSSSRSRARSITRTKKRSSSESSLPIHKYIPEKERAKISKEIKFPPKTYAEYIRGFSLNELAQNSIAVPFTDVKKFPILKKKLNITDNIRTSKKLNEIYNKVMNEKLNENIKTKVPEEIKERYRKKLIGEELAENYEAYKINRDTLINTLKSFELMNDKKGVKSINEEIRRIDNEYNNIKKEIEERNYEDKINDILKTKYMNIHIEKPTSDEDEDLESIYESLEPIKEMGDDDDANFYFELKEDLMNIPDLTRMEQRVLARNINKLDEKYRYDPEEAIKGIESLVSNFVRRPPTSGMEISTRRPVAAMPAVAPIININRKEYDTTEAFERISKIEDEEVRGELSKDIEKEYVKGRLTKEERDILLSKLPNKDIIALKKNPVVLSKQMMAGLNKNKPVKSYIVTQKPFTKTNARNPKYLYY